VDHDRLIGNIDDGEHVDVGQADQQLAQCASG
jgi:hypothetical protein